MLSIVIFCGTINYKKNKHVFIYEIKETKNVKTIYRYVCKLNSNKVSLNGSDDHLQIELERIMCVCMLL